MLAIKLTLIIRLAKMCEIYLAKDLLL